jgi:hypothetical protein
MANKFEQLALWYLRLNGYLTVPNFILHPGTPGSERTDADVLAVRFPYSSEVAGRNMETDSKLVRQDKKVDFIIAEVKSGVCRLNGPWTNEKLENMQYVLRWLGMVPKSEVFNVAQELYSDKRCERKEWAIRLVCFGDRRSQRLAGNILQFTHKEVVEFTLHRFKTHADIKASHKQWDNFIKKFYRMAVQQCKDVSQIVDWLRGKDEED